MWMTKNITSVCEWPKIFHEHISEWNHMCKWYYYDTSEIKVSHSFEFFWKSGGWIILR